ncbi:allatostatin-A receptor-like isoform X1 [Oculina patagonica]
MASSVTSLLYAVFLAAMIIFNIAGNSLVCLVILKKKGMKTSINWLLFHLAIADLVAAVFFIPPCILSHFIEQPSGVIGDMLCKFITGGALGWVAAVASSFLLVVIAFERYNATVRPLEQLSRGRSLWLVPILWILAILLDIPPVVVSAYDVESQMCVANFQDYTTIRVYYLTWSFANSVLPICFMGYPYTRIILCLRNRVLVPGSSSRSVSQSRDKVTKMLISVSAIFITCWTPPTVLCVLSPVIPGGYATVYSVSTASALLNSCLNPLVYALHSQQFRKNIVSEVFCWDSKELATHKTKETNASGIIISTSRL